MCELLQIDLLWLVITVEYILCQEFDIRNDTNCTLAAPDITYSSDGNFIQLPGNVTDTIKQGGRIQVGYMETFGVFQYKGCSDIPNILKQSGIKNFSVRTDPGQCYSACKTSSFAISDTVCYCLPKLDNKDLKEEGCDKQCSDPKNTLCGGGANVKASVYEYINSKDGSLPDDGRNCWAYTTSRSFEWQRCANKLKCICQTSGSPYIFETKTNWKDCFEACLQNKMLPLSESTVKSDVGGQNDIWVGTIKTRVIKTQQVKASAPSINLPLSYENCQTKNVPENYEQQIELFRTWATEINRITQVVCVFAISNESEGRVGYSKYTHHESDLTSISATYGAYDSRLDSNGFIEWNIEKKRSDLSFDSKYSLDGSKVLCSKERETSTRKESFAGKDSQRQSGNYMIAVYVLVTIAVTIAVAVLVSIVVYRQFGKRCKLNKRYHLQYISDVQQSTNNEPHNGTNNTHNENFDAVSHADIHPENHILEPPSTLNNTNQHVTNVEKHSNTTFEADYEDYDNTSTQTERTLIGQDTRYNVYNGLNGRVMGRKYKRVADETYDYIEKDESFKDLYEVID